MATRKKKVQKIRKPTRARTLPKRDAARKRSRFDRSHLRESLHRPQVHRDYAAHFFRWGFAKRFISSRSTVLDVGCGTDGALVKVLHSYLSNVPGLYVGVDLNKLPGDRTPQWSWTTWLGNFDATTELPKLVKKYGQFSVVCCFEVIEHMPKADAAKLLKAMRSVLADGGLLLLSTPVYDGKGVARNHVHEYRIDELQKLLERSGYVIEDRFGTFARQADIDHVALATERSLVKQLKKYYDDDVVACFLAPLYPDAARNNVWLLRDKDRMPEVVERKPRQRVEKPTDPERCSECNRKKRHKRDCSQHPRHVAASTPARRSKKKAVRKKTAAVGPRAQRGTSGRRPGSGARIREMLMKGVDPDEILTTIHREFAGSKATKSDVNWNRRKLRLAGENPRS